MMVLDRMTVMVLVLSISRTAWSSRPSESARNQYKARGDPPQPLRQRAKATDYLSEFYLSHQSDQRTNLIDDHKNIAIKNLSASFNTDKDLGYMKINYFIKSKKLNKSKLRKLQRIKRSFTRYSGNTYNYDTLPYSSITVWRTYHYPISRPYYIPIYGVSDRRPIYFPPQPLLINSGQPDNPKKPFQGTMYLPPNPSKIPSSIPRNPSNIPSSIPPNIDDRFNGGDNGDDIIVWPNFDENSKLEPITTTTMRPTRRTTQAGQTSTHPPIIHNVTGSNNNDQAGGGGGSARPTKKPTIPTEAPVRRPPNKETPPPAPSSCVWAILSCCTPTGEISTNCFEARGCGGFFFDSSNPCDSDFAKAAIESALNYYGP